MVRHRNLTPTLNGSNPLTAVIKKNRKVVCNMDFNPQIKINESDILEETDEIEIESGLEDDEDGNKSDSE